MTYWEMDAATRAAFDSGELAVRDAARFWAKVRKAEGDACWEWTAQLNCQVGYGCFYVSRDGARKNLYAHRYSWELANGAIPPGLQVLHRCDNRKCVRPDHLFLGTFADNMADMLAKGRHRPGRPTREQRVRRLTIEDARRMRAGWRDGATLNTLAAEFGVSRAHVGRIVHDRAWTETRAA